MLEEIKNNSVHYFVDEEGRKQGEYKSWHPNGMLEQHHIYVDGQCHGEYKQWNFAGRVINHFFFVDNRIVSFKVIPYPSTAEDRLYFKLKYDIPLLPV